MMRLLVLLLGLATLCAMAETSFADALLEIFPADQPCMVKHR